MKRETSRFGQWLHDKKLLWRANLYIDEGDGNADWNNRNPWNAPLSDNDWNKDENGNLMTGDSAGKQVIDIKPWTRYYQAESAFDNPTRIVLGSVGYALGASDSPFRFNLDLNNQQNCLNISVAGGWTATTAPKGLDNQSNWTKYDTQIRTQGITTYYPYTPNYSSKHQWIETGSYDWADAQKSAGVDCSAFLQRAVSYPSNRYTLGDLQPAAQEAWTVTLQNGL